MTALAVKCSADYDVGSGGFSAVALVLALAGVQW
jgi:hypothetical protein